MKKPSNIKLISSFIVLMNASTAAIANDYFSGPYIGASAGASFLNGEQNTLFEQTRSGASNGNVINIALGNSVRKNSFFGTAYLGYGQTWCNAYFGTELFIDVANRDDRNSLFAYDATGTNVLMNNKIKVDHVSYGLDFRPGYRILDCSLLYARLGLGFNRFTLASSVLEQFSGGGGSPNVYIAGTTSKIVTRPVFRMGFGLEQMLMDCLTFRIDYIYTNLGKNLLEGTTPSSTSGPVTAFVKTTNKTTLANHAIMLGLAWHF